MLIKVNDLWKFPGVEILIKEDLSNKYLDIGYYRYIDKSNDGVYMLLDARDEICHLEEYDDESTIQVTQNDILQRILNCINGQSVQIMGLIQDGWVEDANDGFNLTPYKEKLNEYIKLSKQLTGSKNEELLG